MRRVCALIVTIASASAQAREAQAPAVIDSSIQVEMGKPSPWLDLSVLGKSAPDDFVVMELYRGSKKVGTAECPVSDRGKVHCAPKEDLIRETGSYRAELGYRSGATGQVQKGWRTVSFQVDTFWDTVKVKRFTINLDHRVGESWLYFLEDSLTVTSWSAPRVSGYAPKATLRCQVGGESVGEPRQDPVDEYTHGAATDAKSNLFVGYADYEIHTALTKKILAEHPGDWSCRLNFNGKPVRVVKWKVDAGGQLVKHPLQAAGRVLAREGVILVDAEVQGDYDRTKGSLTKGAFFGRGLLTH